MAFDKGRRQVADKLLSRPRGCLSHLISPEPGPLDTLHPHATCLTSPTAQQNNTSTTPLAARLPSSGGALPAMLRRSAELGPHQLSLTSWQLPTLTFSSATTLVQPARSSSLDASIWVFSDVTRSFRCLRSVSSEAPITLCAAVRFRLVVYHTLLVSLHVYWGRLQPPLCSSYTIRFSDQLLYPLI